MSPGLSRRSGHYGSGELARLAAASALLQGTMVLKHESEAIPARTTVPLPALRKVTARTNNCVRQSEPPRVCRRLIDLSYAAIS